MLEWIPAGEARVGPSLVEQLLRKVQELRQETVERRQPVGYWKARHTRTAQRVKELESEAEQLCGENRSRNPVESETKSWRWKWSPLLDEGDDPSCGISLSRGSTERRTVLPALLRPGSIVEIARWLGGAGSVEPP